MSWPVFITIPGGDRINAAHIFGYTEAAQRTGNPPETEIHTKDETVAPYVFEVTATELDAIIADAIAATAKLVARAEAEAIDAHREAVRRKQEFYTKPAEPGRAS